MKRYVFILPNENFGKKRCWSLENSEEEAIERCKSLASNGIDSCILTEDMVKIRSFSSKDFKSEKNPIFVGANPFQNH
jgi:hypothetical protein